MTRPTGQVTFCIVFRPAVSLSFQQGVEDSGYVTSPFQDKHVSLKSSAKSLFMEAFFFFLVRTLALISPLPRAAAVTDCSANKY